MQKTLIVCAALAAATAAHGLPTHYAENSRLEAHRDITSRSTLLGDTTDPTKVWVLPPNAGEVKYKGMAQSGNLGFCEAVKDVIKSVSTLEKKLKKIAEQIDVEGDELKRLNKKVQYKRDALAKIIKNPHMFEIKQLEDKIVALDQTIDKLIEKLGDAETEDEIDRLNARIKEYTADLRAAKDTRSKLVTERRKEYREYTIAKQELDAAIENLKTHDDYLLDLNEKYTRLLDSVFQRYKRYIKIEGGIVHLDYDSGWQAEISRLQSKYTDMKFQPIPTYNSRVVSDFYKKTSKDSYFESLPLLLWYNVNGNGQLPYGERLEQKSSERGKHSFPEVVGIDLTLNLVGACPAVKEDFFSEIDYEIERDSNGLPLYAVSTVYEYDVAYKYEVEAKYNLWKFYQKIVSRGTRGGFFSSKSYVDVIEDTMDRDSFDFRFLSETPVPAAEIERVRKEIKSELMNRVLTTIAEPDLRNRPTVPSPGVPPKTGAVVIADGLNKVCGVSIYCQVGGWVFRVAGAIWGSSKVETKIRKSWNRTASERWDSTNMTPRQSSVSYRR